MKKYLFVTVTKEDGFQYPNPLKLSESNLIAKILELEDVESVNVVLSECTNKQYKLLFG